MVVVEQSVKPAVCGFRDLRSSVGGGTESEKIDGEPT